MEMDRILLIDKPKEWTSFDVVAKVRSLLRQAQREDLRSKSLDLGSTNGKPPKIRVGHCGTLDPMATGLLVVVTGKNTKRAQEFTKLSKTYEVEMTLGATSDTGDGEGTIVPTEDQGTKIEDVNEKKLKEVITRFLGEIMQTPPIYSAIKVNGQRAYKLAREGKEVKLEPRKVTIYDIRDIMLKEDKITFTTDVSSGTYIRSLVQDIGEHLGTGAYMSALRRTKIGDFSIKDAESVENLIFN